MAGYSERKPCLLVGYKELHNGLLAEYNPEKQVVMANLRTGNFKLGHQVGYSDTYHEKVHHRVHSVFKAKIEPQLAFY